MGKVRPMTDDESLLLMRHVAQFQRKHPGVQLDWQVIKNELKEVLPGEFDLRQKYQNIKKKGILNYADMEEYTKTPLSKRYEWTRLRNRGAKSVHVAEDNETQVNRADQPSTAQQHVPLDNYFLPRPSDTYPNSPRLQPSEHISSSSGSSSAFIQTPTRSPVVLPMEFGTINVMEENGIRKNQPCWDDQPSPGVRFVGGQNGAAAMADIKLCLPHVTMPTLLSQTFDEYLNLSAHFENRQDRLNTINKCVNMLKKSERDRIYASELSGVPKGQITREMAVLKRTFGNQFDRQRALTQGVPGFSHEPRKQLDRVQNVPRNMVEVSGSTDRDDAGHFNRGVGLNEAAGERRSDHGIWQRDEDGTMETYPNIRSLHIVKQHEGCVRVDVKSLNASGILCVMLDPEPKRGAKKRHNNATETPVVTNAGEPKQPEPVKTSCTTFSTINAVCKKNIKRAKMFCNSSTKTDESVLEAGKSPSQMTMSPIAVENNFSPIARPSCSSNHYLTPTTKESSATLTSLRDSEDEHSDYVFCSTRNASDISVSPFDALSGNNQPSVSIATTSANAETNLKPVVIHSKQGKRFNKVHISTAASGLNSSKPSAIATRSLTKLKPGNTGSSACKRKGSALVARKEDGVSRTSSTSAKFKQISAPMQKRNETPQIEEDAQKGAPRALSRLFERPTEVYRRQKLLPDTGSRTPQSSISVGMVGRKIHTDEWCAIFRFALENGINLCVLTPQAWKELFVKMGVKCCNTGETLKVQFFSIALPNLGAMNVSGFGEINLTDCDLYSLMVIYHSLVDVTCEHIQHVIDNLISDNILSAEKYDKFDWFRNFILKLFSESHEQFGTDYLDFSKVKDAIIGELLNRVLDFELNN